jgi:hypothetical protein
MLNMIRADLFKMFKSSVIKVLFLITVFSAFMMAVFAYLIPRGKIGEEYTGLGFMLSDINTISILGAVIAGVFICGDFENKAIHYAISNGCSRGRVILSKTVVFFSAIVFILLPYAVATAIVLGTGYKYDMGSVSTGFLYILSKDSGIAFNMSVMPKLLIVSGVLMLVRFAQLSLCVPLALLVKKPVLVVSIYYAVSILLGQLAVLKSTSTVFSNILALTPLGGDCMFLTLETGVGTIIKAVTVSVVFITLVLALTYGFFRKSEIK